MKVLCLTSMTMGSALGQTMRLAAIAKALQKRGHEVRFLAGGKISSVIRETGLTVIERPAAKIDLQSLYTAGRDIKQSEESITQNRTVIQEYMQQEAEIEEQLLMAEQPDAILAGNIPYAKYSTEIPCALVFLQPHGKKTLNYFAQRTFRHLMTEERKLKILARMTEIKLLIIEGTPELYGDLDQTFVEEWLAGDDPFKARLRNLADVLKKRVGYTGPLLLDDPETLPNREELKASLIGTPGKPMVYVTIGGGTFLIGEEFLKLVLDMFRYLPDISGLISTGLEVDPGRLSALSPPPNVVIRSFVPGMPAIMASDVTVFHGGSSTLMTCIGCGTPAVVAPSIPEQEDNGSVLVRHQAGIMVDKESLTAASLAKAVSEVANQPAYRQNAQKLRQMVGQYGGADSAASMVERMAGRGWGVEGFDPGSWQRHSPASFDRLHP